jgi:hypothetical protein
MKRLFLVITAAVLAVNLSAQGREPVSFAKEKIATIAKYVQISKDDSTKLQKIFMDYQSEAKSVLDDREKLSAVVKGLSGKIEAVIGVEKYKIYKEKYQADPANQKRKH